MRTTSSTQIHTHRRAFLKSTAMVAAAMSVPRIARCASGANERLAIGCIGVGGRGSDLMNQVADLADSRNTHIIAVAAWRNCMPLVSRVK